MSDVVFACPASGLLEALTGHPLDTKLFVRRSLWWRYYPNLWRRVTHGGCDTPFDAIPVPCRCEVRASPIRAESLPSSTAKGYREVRVLPVKIQRSTGPVGSGRPMARTPTRALPVLGRPMCAVQGDSLDDRSMDAGEGMVSP